MCQPTNFIKLCSCEGKIDKSKAYWELRTDLRGKSMIVGTAILPEHSKIHFENQLSSEKFMELLNKGTPLFDFDYQPKSGDILSIYHYFFDLENEPYHFEYHDGQWSLADPFSLLDLEEGYFQFKSRQGQIDCGKSLLA